jgi:hypothetical protein
VKKSDREVVRTVVQVVSGIAAAIPVFMIDNGFSTDAGAGATAVAVAAAVTKLMNIADDYV